MTGLAAAALSRPALARSSDVDYTVLQDFGKIAPQEGRITLDLPRHSDAGMSVPLTLKIDSPMTPDDYPEVVRIYGSENPRPRIATLRFTPLCGEALFSTRIRLNGAQDVVAVMQTSRGEYWRASQRVSVTFGACATAGGGEEFGGDWQPSIRLSVPEKVPPGGIADIRTIITHPMESGLRLDTRNAYVPLRIIETLTVTLNGETALQTRLAPAISTNPYLAFRLRLTGASLIGFDWQDTTGEIYHREARVAA